MKYIIDLPEQVTIADGVINITGNVGWSVIEKAVHKAVPYNHEAEQGEGLREFEAWFSLFVARLYDNGHIKKDDPMFEAYKKFRAVMEKHPTPDKAVEPLEELAKRKGEVMTVEFVRRGWAPNMRMTIEEARAYLEALPDKGGE